jgi:hypothetical protein
MKKIKAIALPAAVVAFSFIAGFTLGTRHGKAEAGNFFNDVRDYIALGKDLGQTIQRIDGEVAKLQDDSSHLKQIKARLSGEKVPANSAPQK